MATIRLLPQARRRRLDGLIAYAKNHNSSHGEDGVLARLFELIGPSLPSASPTPDRRCFCVDVGAGDGTTSSISHALTILPEAAEERWTAVLVEADAARFAQLNKLHSPAGNICVQATVSCCCGNEDDDRSGMTLPRLLAKFCPELPSDFELLRIGVGGPDYWLLRELLTETPLRPKVICVEFNPTMPHDLVYIQEQSEGVRHGSSLAALHELLCDSESTSGIACYVLAETTKYNAIFVLLSLYRQFLEEAVPETTLAALHDETEFQTRLFQLRDGSIRLVGCNHLLWPPQQTRPSGTLLDRAAQQLSSEARWRAGGVSVAYSDPVSVDGHANGDGGGDDDDGGGIDKLNIDCVDVSAFGTASCDATCPGNESASSAEASSSSARKECVEQLWQRLQTDGFAIVRGTGMPRQVCHDALRATRVFFATSEDVRRSSLAQDRARRGYSPQGTENFASLIGQKGPNDVVQKFRIGNPANEHTTDGSTASPGAAGATSDSSTSLDQPNVWPSGHSEEGWSARDANFFRTSIEAYYAEIEKVGHRILRAIVEGMHAAKVPGAACCSELLLRPRTATATEVSGEDQLRWDTTSSILTLLGYRGRRRKRRKKKNKTKKMEGARNGMGSAGPRPRPDGPARHLVAEHTDVGVITILAFDAGNCAVLERAGAAAASTPGGTTTCDWVRVELPSRLPPDPLFVVNIGDCLSDLTGGCLRSTLHRVIRDTGDIPRHCLAHFIGFAPHAKLQFPPRVPALRADVDGRERGLDTEAVSADEAEGAAGPKPQVGTCTMTFEEWRKARIDRALRILRQDTEGEKTGRGVDVKQVDHVP